MNSIAMPVAVSRFYRFDVLARDFIPIRSGLIVVALLVSCVCHLSASADDMVFPVESNLKAGVAKVDITPAETTGFTVTGHTRVVNGVRDPIRAAVLLLEEGETKVAFVTLDTINAWEDMVRLVREGIEKQTGTPQKNILVAASHNHSGPGFKADSDWGRLMVEKITEAAATAAKDMRTVSIGYGEDAITFGINRRKVIDGRAVIRLNPEGPNDQRVKVLRFDDGTTLTPLAVMMHAVCHPCFFTWGDNGSQPYPKGYPKMSADFPGEAQAFVERVCGERTRTLFLQGCAGDIRPNLPGYPYRCADEADIQWAGTELGSAVLRAAARSMIREQLARREKFYRIRTASSVVMLPGKAGKVRAELQAIKVGPFLFLTMPGEPLVEYGFKLEKAIADRATPIIVGYANGGIGYIPGAADYTVGGYEPNNSPLLPEAEGEILIELSNLADQVVGDVFESFSKHPADVKKREAEVKAEKAAKP